jgi:predicted metalloprotease
MFVISCTSGGGRETTAVEGNPTTSSSVGTASRASLDTDHCFIDFEQVPCTGAFEYLIVRVIDAPGNPSSDSYPGREALEQYGANECGGADAFVPGAESWADGDDEIWCVRFSAYTLEPSENTGLTCVVYDEQERPLLANCDERHDLQVLAVLALDAPPADPSAFMAANCPENADEWIAPTTKQEFEAGFAALACLRRVNLGYADTIDQTVASLQGFWAEAFPTITEGAAYQPLPLENVRPYEPGEDICGEPGEANNAFFCQPNTVAWHDPFLFHDFYLPYGDMAVAVVLAHEWGHAINWQMSTDEVVAQLLSEASKAGALGEAEVDQKIGEYFVLGEHQADCFAGAWVGYLASGQDSYLQLEPGDRNKAAQALVEVRDPFFTTVEEGGLLYERSGNVEVFHGDAAERVVNFTDGFDNGAPACATYFDGLIESLASLVQTDQATPDFTTEYRTGLEADPACQRDPGGEGGDILEYWTCSSSEDGLTLTQQVFLFNTAAGVDSRFDLFVGLGGRVGSWAKADDPSAIVGRYADGADNDGTAWVATTNDELNVFVDWQLTTTESQLGPLEILRQLFDESYVFLSNG